MPYVFGPIPFFGSRRKNDAYKRRYRGQRPSVESLEGRVVPTTDTFTNLAGGSWDVANNWSLKAVPVQGNDVVIPVLNGNATVTLSASGGRTVNSLTLNGSLTEGDTLTVPGGITGGGLITLQGTLKSTSIAAGITIQGKGGTLDGVTLNGNLDIAGGTAGNRDSVSILNGMILDGTIILGTTSAAGDLHFDGSQTLSGTGSIVFAKSRNLPDYNTLDVVPILSKKDSTLTIAQDISVLVQPDSDAYIGSFSLYDSGINTNIINNGTIAVNGTSLNVLGNVTNNATGSLSYLFASNGSTLAGGSVSGTLTNAGTLTLDTLSTVYVGSYAQTSTGNLNISIVRPQAVGLPTPPIVSQAKVRLSGTLTANVASGYVPPTGQAIEIIGGGVDNTSEFDSVVGGTATYANQNVYLTPSATPTQLTVIAEPPPVVGLNAPFDVKVAVKDANGNPVPNFSGPVSITLNPQTKGLGGTLTVNAVNGVADFSNLSINVVNYEVNLQTGAPGIYDLQATATGLTSATTRNFVVGLTPSQLRTAYGFDKISFLTSSGVPDSNYYNANAGKGQTIAIIAQGDDPYLKNSTDHAFASSDLARFDAEFGLPDPPSFLKISQDPKQPNALPPMDSDTNFALEAALDVEYAHALAPQAKIVLVECTDQFIGVATAAAYSGVSVVSDSIGQYYTDTPPYGKPGDMIKIQNEIINGDDKIFTTPANHIPVTFVASTGDNPNYVSYPSISPNVVSVGGTQLKYLSADGSRTGNTILGFSQNEDVWLGSSAGTATNLETEPVYQETVQSTGWRLAPDVSFDAAPIGSVAIYSSTNGGFRTDDGTSLSAPCWAALIALVDQDRVSITHNPAATLDGPSQTLPALYNLPSADFNNNFALNTLYYIYPLLDYSTKTGLGSPVANLIVDDLSKVFLPINVTSQISSTASGLVYNRGTQLFGGSITLTNTGTTALTGSLEVVLTGLPTGVTLANANGYDANGTAYILINLPSGGLAGGQSINFTVLFANPNKTPFPYGLTIYSV